MQFFDFYLRVMRAALSSQCSDGSMPPGHNGPYHDVETPVRITSHYLMAFTKAYELSDEPIFKLAAQRCLSYLLDCSRRSPGQNLVYRTKQGKDRVNGLIGPAWTIEALVYGGKFLEVEEAISTAYQIFERHAFDEKNCIWKRSEFDGSQLSIDPTFNHQLWFGAAAAGLWEEYPDVLVKVGQFLSNGCNLLKVTRSGRIVHPLWLKNRRLKENIKRRVKKKYRRSSYYKEIGYHTFNLYAFAMLRDQSVSFPEELKKKLSRAVRFIRTREFELALEASKYSYAYNPPGWEIPYSLVSLDQAQASTVQHWMEKQISHSFDSGVDQLCKNTEDPLTHNARLYEVVRFPDALFELDLDT